MNIHTQEELEEFLKQTGWQSFEKLVAGVYEENGYETKVNTVITENGKKHQIDVIATGFGKKIVVECKKWNNNNASKLEKEALKQLERKEIIQADKAVIVTLKEFPEKTIGSIPVIPLSRLNNYIRGE